MKKLYDEFFRVSNDEKVKDKVMIVLYILVGLLTAFTGLSFVFGW